MPTACLKLSTGLLLLIGTASGCTPAAQPDDPATTAAVSTPIVIAHRGASGHRPEHTLDAYRYALAQGADFVELDVVATADGELIVRHENLLAEVELDAAGELVRNAAGEPVVTQATTDVAEHPEFASRLSVKQVDGRLHGGWFSEDFTLAEIKTLWARERMPQLRRLNRLYDDRNRIPTLSEVIALIRAERDAGRHGAGLYIELKHPTYFRYEGAYLDGRPIAMDLGTALLEVLSAEHFLSPTDLYIQSFEIDSLRSLKRELDGRSLALPLVQLFGDISNSRYRARPYDVVYHAAAGDDLAARYGALGTLIEDGLTTDVSYADLATPAVLEYMAATYASGIGPPKQNVLRTRPGPAQDPDGDGLALQRWELTGEIGAIAAASRAAGLELHPYTLRAEEPFLVRDGGQVLPVAVEAVRLLEAGATGFFIDQPLEGRVAVAAYLQQRESARIE